MEILPKEKPVHQLHFPHMDQCLASCHRPKKDTECKVAK